MSLTFLPKSSAYSWKMSFDGQVLCKRMLIGPCALTTLGAATVAAPATAARLGTCGGSQFELLLFVIDHYPPLDCYPVNIFRQVLFPNPTFISGSGNP